MKSLLLFAAIFSLVVATAYAAPANQQITSLPGYNQTLNFSQYSGYVDIGDGNNMFYWFVESQRNPSKDPVLVWMNGGPGASSLMGFFTEHGPFRVNPDGVTLSLYPYSWNQIANIIYLEAPVGVGFSYSTDKKNYVTNDTITATNNYKFLLKWFELFPEFQSNPFYVTGESYGGHYVPELADAILEGKKNGSNNINMQGIVVGNPGTNNDWYGSLDEYAYVTFLYEHSIIPQAPYLAAVAACNWTNFLTTCTSQFKNPTESCKKATHAALAYVPPVLDAYDVYSPVCLTKTSDGEMVSPSSFGRRYVEKWHPLFRYRSDVQFEPCLANYMTVYLNLPAVQTALHVQPTKWTQISEKIVYMNETLDMVPLWAKFINQTNWSILIYSGDVDSAVPTIGTQKWINCLGQPVVNDWRPWMFNNQTAGFRQDWQGISFQTLKGCGHMVPYYCPETGYAFFYNWFQELAQKAEQEKRKQ